MKIKPLCILAPIILLITPLHADDLAERRKVAFDLVEARNGANVGDEIFKNELRAKTFTALEKRYPDAEQRKVIEKATEEALATLKRDTFVAAIAEGYAKNLSLDELKVCLEFFRSDAGKALKGAQSQINQEGLAAMESMAKEMGKEIAIRYEALMKSERK